LPKSRTRDFVEQLILLSIAAVDPNLLAKLTAADTYASAAVRLSPDADTLGIGLVPADEVDHNGSHHSVDFSWRRLMARKTIGVGPGWRVAWAAVFAAFLGAGCAGSADESSSTSRPLSVAEADPQGGPAIESSTHAFDGEQGGDVDRVVVDDNTPVSYLQVVMGGTETEKAMNLEIDSRTGDCMREAGFDYTPLVDPATVVLEDYRTVGQWRDEVDSRGYSYYWYETSEGLQSTQAIVDQLDAQGSRTIPPEQQRDYLESLVADPDAPLEAVSISIMTPTEELGGCLGQAVTDVREDLRLPPLSTDMLVELQQMRFETVPEHQAAVDAWSACMMDSGFEFSEPGEAWSAFGVDYQNGVDRSPDAAETRFREERSVAMADFECRVEHLLPVQLALERNALLDMSERFPELAPFVETLDS
jgi:hypothetical protein